MSLEQRVQENALAISAILDNAKSINDLDNPTRAINISEDKIAVYFQDLNKTFKLSVNQLLNGIFDDSVQEFSSFSEFPAVGVSNVIYIDSSFNTLFRWAGTDYVPVGALPVNRPVENEYATVADMQNDQGNQNTGYLQKVIDATGDPRIGENVVAYYVYMGTSTGVIFTDYDLLTEEQVGGVPQYQVNKTFKVSDVTSSAITEVNSPFVKVKYNDSTNKIESIVFDADFSKYLIGMKDLDDSLGDFSVSIFNKTKQKWIGALNLSFSIVNTYYVQVSLGAVQYDVDFVDLDDLLDFSFSSYKTSGGTVQSVTGDGVDNTDPNNPVLTFPEANEIANLQTEISNNTDVQANTTSRHTHANKAILDKFGENVGGKPTYNGNDVDTTIAQRDVYDGLDSNDNTISLSARQGKILNDNKLDKNGNGSQLANVDAETLDGLDSTQFLRRDINTNFNGYVIRFNSAGNKGILTGDKTNRLLIGGGGSWSSSEGAYLILEGTDFSGVGLGGNAYFHLPIGKNVFINNKKVWTSGNDGSGSGLDADLLDGLHSTDFVRSNDDVKMPIKVTSTDPYNVVDGDYQLILHTDGMTLNLPSPGLHKGRILKFSGEKWVFGTYAPLMPPAYTGSTTEPSSGTSQYGSVSVHSDGDKWWVVGWDLQ